MSSAFISHFLYAFTSVFEGTESSFGKHPYGNRNNGLKAIQNNINFYLISRTTQP
jgi:hypothetical protein